MSHGPSVGKSLRTSASTVTDEPDGVCDERPLPHGWMKIQDPQVVDLPLMFCPVTPVPSLILTGHTLSSIDIALVLRRYKYGYS